uniref:Uncharacterized protein n=1 Tax=Nothobranchius korthausae TaxID=1143690 RepID=A0A1A8EU08_9TELE
MLLLRSRVVSVKLQKYAAEFKRKIFRARTPEVKPHAVVFSPLACCYGYSCSYTPPCDAKASDQLTSS